MDTKHTKPATSWTQVVLLTSQALYPELSYLLIILTISTQKLLKCIKLPLSTSNSLDIP